MNGIKRPKVSLSPTYMQTGKVSLPVTVAQRSSIVGVVAENTLKRLPYVKLNGDPSPQLNQCVDTKRLELAIAGSGARIKVLGISQFKLLTWNCFSRLHCFVFST